jgi:hypothetical protein
MSNLALASPTEGWRWVEFHASQERALERAFSLIQPNDEVRRFLQISDLIFLLQTPHSTSFG